MTSPFGVGAAKFHTGGRPGPVDSVYLGVYRRTAIEQVGGYDESYLRAEDWELNHRIRLAGGLIWFQPELRVTYRPRASVRTLGSQYFHYGRWRRVVARQHAGHDQPALPGAPPAAVLAMVAGALVGVAGLAGLAVGSGWIWPVLATAGSRSRRCTWPGFWRSRRRRCACCRPPVAVRLPLALATMHVCLGGRLPDQPAQPDAGPRPRSVAPVSGRGEQPGCGQRAHPGRPGSPARSRVSASSRSPGYVILMLRSLPGTMRTGISGR